MEKYVRPLLFAMMAIIICSCATIGKTDKSEKLDSGTNLSKSKIDVEKEIESWKEDLINRKILGEPCETEDHDREKIAKWSKNNPNLLDGFPSKIEKIGIGKEDFDVDGVEDIILYFNSENCTGHNGGTPSFAKIIYGNGNSKMNVQEDILKSILKAYKQQRKEELGLWEVTDDYLKSTTTIDFNDGKIQGEFRLYTKTDAHCCPSYTGNYVYNPQSKQANIKVIELK